MFNLIRFKSTENAILGRIYLNGAFVCYSLENKSKAIPCGSYTLENGTSPKFKRELPLIYSKEVPAGRGIRIHKGSTASDSAGCVLVGLGVSGAKLVSSADAEKVMTILCRSNTLLLISEQ